MKPKQQPPIDLVDLVKNSGKIQALARCCGRAVPMETGSPQTGNNRDSKDAYIFGSWKRRNRRRPAVTVAVRPVSVVSNENERNNNQTKQPLASSQRSSTYYPSSYTSSFNPDSQADGDVLHEEGPLDNEEEFWCPRCGRKMQEPRLLQCLHPICSPCVDELINQVPHETCSNAYDSLPRDQSSSLREGCPICDMSLPTAGSPLPPPHYPLQHRLVMDAVRRRLDYQILCCDSCPEEVQALVHCPTCLRNFCSDCGTEHQEQVVPRIGLSGHEVRPLWEARKFRRTALCLTHPTHALRFHCIACQQVTCRECMWRGAHRGHSSEGAAGAGRRAATLLTAALQNSRTVLNKLLMEYNHQMFYAGALDRPHSLYNVETERCSDTYAKVSHCRSRSTMSSHTKEARERMQEFARLQRARYLLDAISLGEDLLADGSDVEILSLSRIILKRLKNLGVKPVLGERGNEKKENVHGAKKFVRSHTGVYHCCTFCSSGGKKEATCACPGTMPGGYKGCGHGHSGHPGVSHWSCCGTTRHDGECLMPRKCMYQITL